MTRRWQTLTLVVLPLILNAMAITRYVPEGQEALFGLRPSSTDTSLTASYTGTAAYDPRTLTPPVPPTDPPVNTQFAVQLVSGDIPDLSIRHHGAFLGFSIEFSVSNHVLGRNGSTLSVPFLNLLANLQRRSGRITVRVGGNSQETAMMVPSLADGGTLEKDKAGLYNPTQTPPLVYTPEILYMMSNISTLVNVDWYLGVPFNDTTNWRLDIVQRGQQILGNRLLGFQAGNEPDLYVSHGRRNADYGSLSYKGEIASLLNTMRAQGLKTQNQLITPSVNGKWPIEEVIQTGILDEFRDEIGVLSVEKYPSDNCAAAFKTGAEVRQPQEMLPTYLTHATGVRITQQYLNATRFAQEVGKPFMMFETNSASCGGFPGVSDAFAAALWGLDYGLMMAHSNFTGALFHVGGQNVYYSPFTPPPSNQTAYRQWSVGPIYYTVLAMSEIMGRSNRSQVIDLGVNNGEQSTPGYAIYENGTPMRLALFNYLDDSSGAHDLRVSISIGGGETGQAASTPPSVRVKYLLAEHVTSKVNITWAGQTLGTNFKSDGRLRGEESIVNVPCDTTSNTCTVTVPAPGFALVFLNDKAFEDSTPSGNTLTFATTARTKTVNTATIDPKALETSNGHKGKDRVKMQSTSKGSSPNGASRLKEGLAQVVMTGLGVGFGAALFTLL